MGLIVCGRFRLSRTDRRLIAVQGSQLPYSGFVHDGDWAPRGAVENLDAQDIEDVDAEAPEIGIGPKSVSRESAVNAASIDQTCRSSSGPHRIVSAMSLSTARVAKIIDPLVKSKTSYSPPAEPSRPMSFPTCDHEPIDDEVAANEAACP